MVVHNRSRGGLTLMEVLIAIFVMGIGMLALLTLFPVGAMRMDQAIKDEKAALAAANARAYAKVLNVRNDLNVLPYYLNSQNSTLANKPTLLPWKNNVNNVAAGVKTDPSYAVFVDPAGVANSSSQTLLDNLGIAATQPSYGQNVARVTSSQITTAQDYYQYFTVLDDITFNRGAAAPRWIGSNYDRTILYTYAYLVQRPVYADDRVVNCTACVFYRRPLAGIFETVVATNQNYPQNKVKPVVTMDYDPLSQNPNSIEVQFNGNIPINVQPGGWILDTTRLDYAKLNIGSKMIPLANFYRVTGVRETGTAVDRRIRIDLQTPLVGYDDPVFRASFPQSFDRGCIVYMEGLLEVFDLGPGR